IRKQEERRALRQLPPAVFNRRQLDWFLSRVHPIAEPAWWLSPLAGWEICFWPAGHIRGAASVLLNTPEGSVMFTGDVSAGDQPTVAGARTPDCFRPDVLVTETTYGGRDLPPREEEVKRLVGRVLDVKRRGGKVLIPAFAVGRSVDVALDLIGQGIPVYLDGMARIMAEIYHSADASWCGLDRPFPLPDLIEEGFITMVPREKEAGRYRRDSRLAGEEPAGHDFSVMVSPSGTLDGGYSLKYAKQIFNEYRSAIFFPGFLMEGTAGKQVAEIERGRAVKIGEEVFNVRCEVERFNLSAHDSADNLLARVKALAPRKVILIHGEPAAQNALRERIVAIPAFPAVFEGKTGKTIEL
ncbi:MAG: MBL fold metallo-hydrolase, partial [Parcubacteria group bacterium]|nr:MBL fold metallo-hydrolase [Parcubacteria group bacterium]